MRIVELRTGQVSLETAMDDAYFGEGVTLIRSPNHDEPVLMQLTWKEQEAFTYHPESLQLLSNFSYQTTNGQGWGIAFDLHKPNIAYVTDGTAFVHTWQVHQDKALGTWSYEEISKVPVTFAFPESQRSSQVFHINELEYDPVTRTLLANVYGQDVLIRIDIDSGFITKVYDLSSLYTERTPQADVFNGIAVIPNQPGFLYVTGKLWPYLYYIELIE